MSKLTDRRRGARPLSPSESFPAAGAMTIAMRVDVVGELNTDALRAAFDALHLLHPVLGGRIVATSNGFELEVDGSHQPVVQAIRIVAEGAWRPRVDQQDHLCAMQIGVQDGGDQFVALLVHHSIADGRQAVFYFQELWRLYGEILTAAALDTTPHPLPSSPEQVLADRGITRLDTSILDRLTGTVWIGLRRADFQPHELSLLRRRIRLDEHASHALRDAAREQGLTVQALVCGALVVAERAMLRGFDPEQPADFGVTMAVDIRERLEPKVSMTEGTNIIGSVAVRQTVAATSDPVDVGRSVIGQLHADLASGVALQTILHPEDMAGMADIGPTISVTNIGALPAFYAPPSLKIVDFRGIIESDFEAFVRQLEETGTRPQLGSLYVVNTYAGQLSVEAIYPGGILTDAECDDVVAGAERHLRAMASASRLDTTRP